MKLLSILLLLFSFSSPAYAEIASEEGVVYTAIAMHGEPKYGADFTHFDYVNPNAPKGGTLKLGTIGTFDSLNPYIVKGVAAAGNSLIYESLLTSSYDEPFSKYGLLAESFIIPEDRSWVIFNLRPEARWQDGKSVTAEDVKWSFETLISKGRPLFKTYYSNISEVSIPKDGQVKFTFDTKNNRELPLIIGEMPVFPKHYWEAEGNDFSATTLTPFIGSGPYKFEKVDAGTAITYMRDPNWWGKDLAVNKGRHNFERITYQYYRDHNVALEAFFAGDYDVRFENTAKLWATAYDTVPAVTDGRIIKERIENETPQGMQAFIYNLRRPVFQDKVVRQALAYAFDYEWSNKQFAFSTYTRSRSYFSNSMIEADNLPTGDELALLETYKEQLPPELFTTVYNPPKSDGSGQNRANLRKAQRLLEEAGYVLGPDGVRVDKSGKRLEFEFVDNNPAFERWILPFIQNLEKIGVKATFRVVDPAQYQKRMTDFDFDMTVIVIPQSNSPGNEQRSYWHSNAATTPGSRNYIGIQDPVVDELIEKVVMAESRENLVTAARALDRVLQHGYYVIPNWHYPAWRIARWNYIKRPDPLSPLNMGIEDTW